ncbi:hypothetical protein GCM10011608_56530 [Micromonospora sonchi]|uniref:PPM-type phosphatase domain-containing protein n=2 Tax=Micromonospora sonchi TaxID=1763543 RepID=A0A917UA46_9ACTN|nr:hypothetical protein GCM10011608_56530 [Micromonospora sonchi]
MYHAATGGLVFALADESAALSAQDGAIPGCQALIEWIAAGLEREHGHIDWSRATQTAVRRVPIAPGDLVVFATKGVRKALGADPDWTNLLTDHLQESRPPVELVYELSRLAGGEPDDLALFAVWARPGIHHRLHHRSGLNSRSGPR